MLQDHVEPTASLKMEIGGILAPDPDGDAIFKLQDQTKDTTTYFRVSSKVLQLASRVFVGMFSPYFQEGQKVLQKQCPVIEFEEDDAALMGLILNVLHYRAGDGDHVMNPESLARLSIHCDKYECVNALGAWVSHWFKNVKEMSQSSKEFGFMLLAAYMFNDSGKFMELSKAASKELAPGFSVEWEEEEMLAILPSSISSAITLRIKRTLDKLESKLQSVESSLRNSSRCYDTSQLFCIDCGRTLPGQAKKCHPCNNTTLPQKYCTSETRISDYFAVLRKVELWPTTVRFGIYSISDTAVRFTCAKAELKHSCSAGTSCPLLLNLNSLLERVDRIKRDMEGFCLRCVREDDEWEECHECTHMC
ncbi:hypothetical protein P154DRAFT_593126 [Amniculicola lignicola CBS 123094]|uniref:BTB domain-containing protein n=1 Tax=Amniculicola lignicola CBS 123094 TaxID=1392246 RepID=A0A6A5X3T4_9PLEO|nr:hypothetical protein P154DRAFT_593126 [Amniculicola lignicola CBS 123094]